MQPSTKIEVAKSAGFCSGVARAVYLAYKYANKVPTATLGAIIHNRTVTDDLARLGLRIITDPSEAAEGETVLIRSHGVPRSVKAELARRGIPYVDCTCPWVKALHNYAEEAKTNGHTLILLGDAKHPEIIGAASYADKYIVIENRAQLQNFLQDLANFDSQDLPREKYTLAAQTTLEHSFFADAKAALSAILPAENFISKNSICSATAKRQEEAEKMSKNADVMLVLGDSLSANTNKLYQICKQNCKNTYLLETISKKQLQKYKDYGKLIGITAGASTPPSITKEANKLMNELMNTAENAAEEAVQAEMQQEVQQNEHQNERASELGESVPQAINEESGSKSFEEMLNENFVTLHTGDVVTGTVLQVTPTEITVNLGYKSDGICTKSEYSADPNIDLPTAVSPGDEIEVFIMRVNDGDGNVLVSKRRLDAHTNYKLIEKAYHDKEVVMGRITDLVKGGLIANILGNRVFVPSSQISNRYVEDLSVFKGQELNFNILEFDRSKRRMVAGRKELVFEEQRVRREELYGTLKVGDKIAGVVSRTTSFGAFIDLGGVDGLVHISELSWKRVRNVQDVVKPGDEVTVIVLDINPEKHKISLSLRDPSNNPWNNISVRYPIGELVEGKVVRITSFGAFVNLEDGIDGLVHISQISNRHVNKPDDELEIGQIINVKVTDVDEENRKISLSKKLADEPYYDEEEISEEAPEEVVEETPEEATAKEVAEEPVAEEAAEEPVAEEPAEEPTAEEPAAAAPEEPTEEKSE